MLCTRALTRSLRHQALRSLAGCPLDIRAAKANALALPPAGLVDNDRSTQHELAQQRLARVGVVIDRVPPEPLHLLIRQ